MHKTRRYFLGALSLLAAGAQAQPPVADAELSRGRYLAATSGQIIQVRYSALILT